MNAQTAINQLNIRQEGSMFTRAAIGLSTSSSSGDLSGAMESFAQCCYLLAMREGSVFLVVFNDKTHKNDTVASPKANADDITKFYADSEVSKISISLDAKSTISFVGIDSMSDTTTQQISNMFTVYAHTRENHKQKKRNSLLVSLIMMTLLSISMALVVPVKTSVTGSSYMSESSLQANSYVARFNSNVVSMLENGRQYSATLNPFDGSGKSNVLLVKNGAVVEILPLNAAKIGLGHVTLSTGKAPLFKKITKLFNNN